MSAATGAGAVSAVEQRRSAGAAGARRPRVRATEPRREPRLPLRVRLADGRTFTGAVAPERHRAIQLGLLHSQSEGLVELTPGTRPPGGKVDINRRTDARHYLPGGAGASDGQWLERLLEHAEQIVAGEYAHAQFKGGPREEAFVGVTPRTRPCGNKDAVAHTRFLWLDVDKPDRLPALWDFLAERPCHLLVESAGSGGCHAYFRLDRPLVAVQTDARTGEVSEWVERANARLIHRLGSDGDGNPTVADPSCRKRSQPMRLAGTINWKTGRYARVLQADFALTPYPVSQLVGDLPDPMDGSYARSVGRQSDHDDPYKLIPAVEYMRRIAGREANRAGFVRCPNPAHADEHPSCSIGGPRPELWQCQSCAAAGSIYDLASLMLGGPTGKALRDEHFKVAKQLVRVRFGEPR